MSIQINGTSGISGVDGTASTPALQGTDSNTGISFGTDEVKIVTGGNDRVTVDSSGNVGIGTTAPEEKLDVDGAITWRGGLVSGKTSAGALDRSGNDLRIRAYGATSGTGQLVFRTGGGGGSADNEAMRIDGSGSLFAQGVYDDTTAQAATVHVGSDGHLYRSTSSIRYKKDVETLQDAYADAILDCRPVWYRSTTGNDNPDHGYWGFIAEEVAEIDPRLVHWRTTESVVQEDGNRISQPCDPEPEGVQYDRFVPHLLNLIKRQKEQIEAQGTAIAALEARLTALEGGTAQ